jgi:5-methylthioadenosine/S-adenosylhomocysteine deaminase
MAPKEKESLDSRTVSVRGSSRRGFLKGGAGLVAGVAATQLLPSPVAAQQPQSTPGTFQSLKNPNGRAILLKDGIVLSMDPNVGDFEKGDILVQGKKIVSVGRNVAAPKSAIVVNAAGMIVMPGFIDTHHHQFETPLRSILSDGLLGTAGDTVNSYQKTIIGTFTPAYLPEDARIGELVASLSQLNAGVTTTVDTSQVSLTPEHTDACIAGLKESGRRVLFAYSAGQGAKSQYPQDIVRLRKQHFSSDDQLLTLALGDATNADHWKRQGGNAFSHVERTSFVRMHLIDDYRIQRIIDQAAATTPDPSGAVAQPVVLLHFDNPEEDRCGRARRRGGGLTND